MDHLPECPAGDREPLNLHCDCICDRLRACEARVREEAGFGCCDALWNKGYAAALTAARDAVAALIAYEVTKDGHLILRGEAEAAINALRGTP